MNDIFPGSFYSDGTSATYIMDENRILGLARLRQIRVRGDSCVVPKDFRQEIRYCYADWDKTTEDKTAFGMFANNNGSNPNDTANNP